jgi:predicted nucleic acid-binding protein
VVNPIILLDSGPLGSLTTPRFSPLAITCKRWFQSLASRGRRVLVPEIADYELRRELLRANKVQGVANLDRLIAQTEYLPITTIAMRQAAQFWAQARQQGQPTAGDNTIDCDMILAAQAVTLGDPNVIIATTNIKHLSRFVPADFWQNIS